MKRLKIGITLLSLLGLASGFYFSFKFPHRPEDNVIRVALSNIPSDEKWALDYFFRSLLLRDGGAYVLNGTKPATVGDFGAPSLREVAFFGWRLFRTSVLLKRGYEIWMKYRHLFPHSNYAILCLENKEFDRFHIVLVNKKRFACVIEENLNEFRAVLGPGMTTEALLDELAKEKQSLYQLLNDHSGLLGIILGYGKHNAWLFYQREQIESQIDTCQFLPKRFDLMESELNALNGKFQLVDQKRKSRLLFASSPSFVFDPQHPETQELLAQYKQQRKELTEFYGNGSFLEIALRKLAE